MNMEGPSARSPRALPQGDTACRRSDNLGPIGVVPSPMLVGESNLEVELFDGVLLIAQKSVHNLNPPTSNGRRVSLCPLTQAT